VPELPEVEAARVAVTRVAKGRRIVRVWCADDPIVFDRVPAARVRRALVGRRVLNVRRRGKHLWFELDRRPWPCFHFGMTGGFHSPREKSVKLVSSGERRQGGWPPRFAKLRLLFDDGSELVMADARRLGRIRLRHDPAAEPPIGVLGFDALLELPSPARFAAMLRARRSPLKAILLDQSFAGIGHRPDPTSAPGGYAGGGGGYGGGYPGGGYPGGGYSPYGGSPYGGSPYGTGPYGTPPFLPQQGGTGNWQQGFNTIAGWFKPKAYGNMNTSGGSEARN